MSELLSFGGWLKRRRQALDLTQRALAHQVGCSAISIRKMESADLVPSRQLAQQLAVALAVPSGERAAFIQFARSPYASAGDTAFTARSAARSAPDIPTYRLPAPLTELVGRERELDAGCRLL